MVNLATVLGSLGVIADRGRARAAALEWIGGCFLVSSFVGLGFDLARSMG